MPDTSFGPASPADDVGRPAGDAGDQGLLDVPEWVSELRRLYVEPKTRAKLRQEGVIAPRKRKIGLPVGRGSRRNAAADASAADGAASAPRTLAETAAQPAAPSSPPDPGAAQSAPPDPDDSMPMLDESGAPYTPPGPAEEKQVAIWLTSYLAATGHAAEGDGSIGDSRGNGDSRDSGDSRDNGNSRDNGSGPLDPADAVSAPAPDAPARPAVGVDRVEALIQEDRPTPAPVAPVASVPAAERAQVAPEHPVDAVPEVVPTRSLADLAGLTVPEPGPEPPGTVSGEEPSPAPGVAPRDEPWRAVRDGAGVLVSTGGDSATPNAAVASPPSLGTEEPEDSAPEADRPRPPSLGEVTDTDAAGIDAAGVDAAGVDAAGVDAAGVDAAGVRVSDEAGPMPGRPRTVSPVTLSWREAESFEIGVPGVEDPEGAIVVEAPSQLVAQRRGRRRDFAAEHTGQVDPEPAAPAAASPGLEAQPPTRASARAASGYQSGKRRRMVVVALVLVLLAVVAWYFLLRPQDGGSAAPAGSSHVVVASPVTGLGQARSTTAG